MKISFNTEKWEQNSKFHSHFVYSLRAATPMKKEIYNLEGIEIEVEKYDKSDKDAERRRLAYPAQR